MKTMNHIALLLAAAIGTTGLYAQTKVEANIPFDFAVKGQKMPAGTYEVTRDLTRPDLVKISNVDGSRSVQVVTYKAMETEPGTASPGWCSLSTATAISSLNSGPRMEWRAVRTHPSRSGN